MRSAVVSSLRVSKCHVTWLEEEQACCEPDWMKREELRYFPPRRSHNCVFVWPCGRGYWLLLLWNVRDENRPDQKRIVFHVTLHAETRTMFLTPSTANAGVRGCRRRHSVKVTRHRTPGCGETHSCGAWRKRLGQMSRFYINNTHCSMTAEQENGSNITKS